MRIAIDGTPAATQSAGVGRYTRELLKALVTQSADDQYQIACASTREQAEALDATLGPGQWRTIKRLPVSERYLTAFWHRLNVPLRIDTFLEPFDVFHGPDFVVPPSNKASVVTVHDLSYLVRPDLGEPALVAYLTRSVPRTIARADAVITVSASVASELVAAYPFVRDKVRAIPNGVARRATTLRLRPARKDRPTLLIVGTIEPRKNHLTLLNAMPLVWQEFPDAQLIVAGRVGWQSGAIMERLVEACATSAVEFVESPGDADLDSLYSRADLFVYPSHYEGFGLPVLEAMQHDVPVVASNIAALRETAGSAARFHEPDDAEELAHHITTLLNDAELRRRLVDEGRRRVDQHSWNETARRTRRTYQAAVEARTHG